MIAPPDDLSRLRILVSNDDGIAAPGIKVLERIARSLSKDVWVVAPEHEQSAAGHSLTIRRPLRVRTHGRRRYSVDGTPTDAVLLGVNHIIPGRRPDLVLSGINRGANIGEDVTYSGTVAAAMEATLLGIRAIALSQLITPPAAIRWDTAEAWAIRAIRPVLGVEWGPNVLININFPDVPADQVSGIVVARQGRRKLGDAIIERADPRGDPYVWIGAQRSEERSDPGTDVEAVLHGAVSVTPLSVDLTHHATMQALAAVLP
jgi:5'-nucleotidase